MFADKYLKKRYLLPQKGRMGAHIHCLPERWRTLCVYRF
jgi:hypothetical protein